MISFLIEMFLSLKSLELVYILSVHMMFFFKHLIIILLFILPNRSSN